MSSLEQTKPSFFPPEVAMPEVSLRVLRGLLALYIVLWVFEGALRKWILPSLANPLLVVRDPVLLAIYAIALAKGIFPRNAFVGWIAILGGIAFLVSFVSTETPMLVALYGLRAGYLHLPLIFVLGSLFNIDDVKVVGRYVLIMALPMAILVLLQFRASEASFLNVGAGGSTGGMIESAYGHIRPSGTFSFTNGLSGFTALVSSFFLFNLLEKRVYPRLLWLAVGPMLIILIVLSGSRQAVGTLLLIVCTVLLISVLQPKYAGSAVKLLLCAGVAVLVLGSFAVFKEGLNVFTYRFGSAGNVQSGFFGRFFRSLTEPFAVIKDSSLGGAGLGMGTNVAAGIISGKREFLMAEGELARVLLESGPIVGITYILTRAALVVYLGWVAFMSLRRDGRTLPLLLFTGCFNDVLQGQFSQPTELGYATIAGGLCLAANRLERETVTPMPVFANIALKANADSPDVDPPVWARPPTPPDSETPNFDDPADAAPHLPPVRPAAPPENPPKTRGRSLYAERLHGPDKD